MNEKEFWKILDKLDWNNEGDDDLVLKPVIKYLSKLKDEEIFAFHEIMSKLLKIFLIIVMMIFYIQDVLLLLMVKNTTIL